MAREHLALVIDDDEEILIELETILRSIGHRFQRATHQEEAEARLAEGSFCYVLLDLHLPVGANSLPRAETGFNILRKVRQDHSQEDLPVIVMTAHGKETEVCTKAFKLGATDFITKPFTGKPESIEDKIREAVEGACESRSESCPGGNGGGERRPISSRRRAEPSPKQEPPVARGKRSGKVQQVHRPVFKFVGKMKKKRVLLEIDGAWGWVMPTTFSRLWQLAVALLENPAGGWVCFKPKYEPSKLAWRIENDVNGSIEGLKVPLELQSDGWGNLRLPTVAENILFDADIMEANLPGEFGRLPERLRR